MFPERADSRKNPVTPDNIVVNKVNGENTTPSTTFFILVFDLITVVINKRAEKIQINRL